MNPSPTPPPTAVDGPPSALGISCQCDPAEDVTPHMQEGGVPPLPLGERLRRLAWDLGSKGSTGSADLLLQCAAELVRLNSLRAEVLTLEGAVVDQQREIGELYMKLRPRSRVALPGESMAEAPPLTWAENPPPNEIDPLVVVVSQRTAVRALVRHYGWVHDGPDTLVRPRYPAGSSAAPPKPAPCGGVVEDLLEAPGSIADQAAAAAAAVA